MSAQTRIADNPFSADARCAWAVALILCGQPIMWTLRGSLGFATSAVFPAIPILLGTALLFQPHWLFGLRLRKPVLHVAIPILLFQLPIAMLSLTDLGLMADQAAYMFVLCPIVFFLACNEEHAFRHVPFTLMVVGAIGCLAALFDMFSQGGSELLRAGARLSVEGNSNPLATAFNGAVTALAALVVGVTCGRNRLWVGAAAATAFSLGLSNVLLSFTRSAVIFFVLCALAYVCYLQFLVKKEPSGGAGSRKRTFAFLAGLVIFFISTPIILRAIIGPIFDNVVMGGLDRFQGVLGLVGVESVRTDQSSSVHSLYIQYNWDHWTLFGNGIMAQSRAEGAGAYAHLSYLQALYDLGMVGGVVFLLVAAVIPLVMILARLRSGNINSADALIMALFAYAQGDHMMHVTPYAWETYLLSILPYVLLSSPRRVSATQGAEAVVSNDGRGQASA